MATITYLTQIEFGSGSLTRVASCLDTLGGRRPLIVTDRGIVAAGLLDRLQAELPAGLPVFDGTPGNPTEEAAQEAAALYRREGCDSLIAMGGGSPIDLAKAVGLLVTHKGALASYAAIDGGVARIGEIVPVIAIPTTAGTGSEVGRAALLTLQDGRKVGLISPHLIPKLAICDPDLTHGLPAGLTAATGIDAISHCVETFLSPRDNPVADAIALDGLQRAVTHIERAVLAPQDAEARSAMMMASLQGGLCFQKGLGAIHALSHPLGAYKQINPHHGTLNGILLAPVLRRNAAACEAKYAAISARLGIADGDVPAFFAALVARLNLPKTLGEVGFDGSQWQDVVQAALKDHSAATNPVPFDGADYLAILEEAA